MSEEQLTYNGIDVWDAGMITRGTAILMTKTGPILMHPLDTSVFKWPKDPTYRVEYACKWFLDEAKWKLDDLANKMWLK